MDRNEAMLRELNLYPQWVLRDVGASHACPEPVEAARETVEQAHARCAPTQIEAVVKVGASLLANENREQARSYETSPETPLLQNTASNSIANAAFVPATTWPELKQQVRDCQRCGLRAGCTQTVFGVGNERADWLFIGEGPGADEDVQGEPFVGQAGKLLDNMLMAIKLSRGKQVYIANIVKCRPPNNRNPAADEIAQCLPYLQRQIELVQPKLIVALGKVAANNLLGEDVPLGSLRGTLHDYHGIPLIVTYHPAYLLRSPSEKAKAWEDLCFAVDVMNEAERE